MRAILALLLVLALIFGLAGASHAIVIDAGSVTVFSLMSFTPAVYVLQGERFAIAGASIQVDLPPGPTPQLFTVPQGATVDLSGTISIHPYPPIPPLPPSVPIPGPVIVFNGESFVGATGSLTFSTPPFDPLVDGTFTMTGQLTFGSQTVTLEGVGNALFVESERGIAPDLLVAQQLRFEFSPVPEPTTLTLIGTLGGVGSLYGLSRRRGRRV